MENRKTTHNMDIVWENDPDFINIAMILFTQGGEFSLENVSALPCGGVGGRTRTAPCLGRVSSEQGTKSRTTTSAVLALVVRQFWGANSSLQQTVLQVVFQASDWLVQ